MTDEGKRNDLRDLIVATIVMLVLVVVPMTFVVWEVAGPFGETSDWAPVRAALVRLQSGIELEPVIALRSTLANADAALKIYSEKQRHPHSEARFVTASRAISNLRLAIEFRSVEDYRLWAVELRQRPAGSTSVYDTIICKSGRQVVVDGDDSFSRLETSKAYLQFALSTPRRMRSGGNDLYVVQQGCPEVAEVSK